VEVLVPLIPERALREGGHLTNPEGRNTGVAPEAHLAVGLRNCDRRVATIHGKEGAGEGVLGTAPIGRGAEARVLPGAGPHSRQRIDLRIVMRLLVADQGAIGGASAVDAGLPADLPESFIAAEEREMDAGRSSRLHVGPLPR